MQEPAKSSQPPDSEHEAEHALRSRVLCRVLSGAVHDIRTPLGTMVMKLQLLRDGASEGGLPEQIAQHLRVLDAQVERVTEMLRKMASTVEPPSPLGWVDLAALLGDGAGALAYDAKMRGVEVTLEPRMGSVRTGAEPDAVGRIVLCLFGWALAGTPRGGRIAGRAVARDGAAVLELERSGGDPGVGVGYEWEVLAAAAATLRGRLERSRDGQALERLTLAIPQAGAAAGDGQG